VTEGDRALSPGAARRHLGVLLRQLRDRAGLRLEDAGAHIERSSATLSRLENGKSVPRLVDVRALLDLYAASAMGEVTQDERDRAILLAADSRKEEWFDPFRDVIAGDMMTQSHMDRYVQWETDAEEILTYQAEVVPGLLQTRNYAQALTDLFYPDSTPRQRKRFVDFRMARQDVLRRRPEPLVFHVTLREVVLQRIVGSNHIMIEQLRKLATELRDGLPNLSLRVVPDRLVVPEALRGPFTVMRLPVHTENDGHGLVYVEGAGAGEYLQNAAAVDRYRRAFAALWRASLSREASLHLVEDIAESLR
jgi:transcriptional regulator with XRE-family HTH domain